MGLKVAWNRDKSASVVLSKMKEYTINISTYNSGKFSVYGWYNAENSFLFGDDFNTREEAQAFLNDIFDKL
jgi:hypothetical protein